METSTVEYLTAMSIVAVGFAMFLMILTCISYCSGVPNSQKYDKEKADLLPEMAQETRQDDWLICLTDLDDKPIHSV